MKDGTHIYTEVKYESDLEKEDVKEQISVQKSWCETNGKVHKVMTDKEIRKNPIYLENLKEMIPYVLNSSSPVEIDCHKINSQLNGGKKTISDLNKSIDIGLPRLYEAIFCMLYSGDIQADIDQKYFGIETEVWLAQ